MMSVPWARIARICTAMLLAGLIVWISLSMWWPLRGILWAGALVFMFNVVRYRGSWRGWLRIKLREWATDIKQLWMWARLAFKRKRDDQDVAAMAHQARFLDGRMLSPVNTFTYLPLIIGIVGLAAVGIDQWRIDRIKRERDAPCSQRELSQDDAGQFRTSRASCAQLGATNEVAQQWRQRAENVELEWARDVQSIRDETADEIARLQQAAQQRVAASTQQRRRINEGIEAALGGGPPDLERSLCELAGNADCGASDRASNGASDAAPIVMPDAD